MSLFKKYKESRRTAGPLDCHGRKTVHAYAGNQRIGSGYLRSPGKNPPHPPIPSDRPSPVHHRPRLQGLYPIGTFDKKSSLLYSRGLFQWGRAKVASDVSRRIVSASFTNL